MALGMFLSVLVGASSSFADGFICEGLNTRTTFKIYNKTYASEGTRNVAVMIVTNPLPLVGSKTAASFSESKNTLTSSGTNYTATVDLRVTESSDENELVGGTKLGGLSTIKVHVFFNYLLDTPSHNGQKFKGYVDYLKRNGEILTEKIECSRYVKN